MPTNLVKLEPAGTPSPYGGFNHADDPPLIISPDDAFPPTVSSGGGSGTIQISPREGHRSSTESGPIVPGAASLLAASTVGPVRNSNNKTTADARRGAAGLLPVKTEVLCHSR